jgi:alpha-D-xyloside xylohydrolase
VLSCALSAACGGDDDGLAPAPESVSEGGVTIQTDPLRLIVDAPSGTFEVDDFIEVATVASVVDNKYYDPRDLDANLAWTAATRAVGLDENTGELVLDNDVRIALADTLTVDARDVDNAVLVRIVFPRDDGEAIFGFGESFRSAVAGGDVREMQMRVDLDSESSLNETHVPVPLSMWPARGVGVFVEDPRPGAFDIGAARTTAVLATFTLAQPGPFTVHLFTAEDPLDLVRRYVTLTATPALPPMWAFAPQQWRNQNNSSQEVRDDANAMRDNDIPGSVMWIDNPWQTAYNDFTIDETRFENADAMLAELEALGYKVLVWSTPYVNNTGPTREDFLEAAGLGYLITDGDSPLVLPWQDGPGALVDFTAAGATEWWRERIGRVTARGIDGFKLDFGEDVVPELGGTLTPFTLAGGNAQTLHNAYAHYYHDAYLGALPEGDGFLITRSGSYGEQAVNTAIWPGDLDSDFSRHGVDNGDGQINVGGLPAAVAGGLSLSVSGYPFYGSDIGGFRDGPTSTETLLRWAEYAALGTIMQLGGGGKSHNPWDTTLFGAEALPIYQRYARLHMDLVPYIYTLAVAAAADGTPVVRPTRMIHPDAASDDATYFVGDALFVAPVIEQGATTRDVVLPPGDWVDWWTAERVQGDGAASLTADAPLDTLPLWQRCDSIVPMFALEADTLVDATAAGVRSYLDAPYANELRLVVAPCDGAAVAETYDGTTANSDAGVGRFELSAGASFDVATFDFRLSGAEIAGPTSVTWEGLPVAEVADDAELRACAPPGCYRFDGGAQRLQVRVHGSGAGAWN